MSRCNLHQPDGQWGEEHAGGSDEEGLRRRSPDGHFLGESATEKGSCRSTLCENSISRFFELPLQNGLSSPWFERVWIYQELVASRDPWLQCGLHKIRWETFYTIFQDRMKIVARSHSPNEGTDSSLWSRFFHMADERIRIRYDTYLEKPYAQALPDTLLARRGLGVFDPRDMLFAHCDVVGHMPRTVV